mgnify:CR=1 FL=1
MYMQTNTDKDLPVTPAQDAAFTRFITRYDQILDCIEAVDPAAYARTRNFVDGAVTRLSPYISRGLISTRMVMRSVLARDPGRHASEKLLQELAWRDYWQQVWIAKGDAIDSDLRQPQQDVCNQQMPRAVHSATTGIEAVDAAIVELYRGGYMHNHMRMYTAALACNIGKSHWRVPAQWMYYHLLDGDWASNALSWQWVAGANANKKYIANQENINKYFHSRQRGTFLDVSYEELAELAVPEVMRDTDVPALTVDLPVNDTLDIDPQLPTLVYNYYNLEPAWREHQQANRVLLLEPSVFRRYPVAARNIEFVRALADNIAGVQVMTAEFDELERLAGQGGIFYKEHPLNSHYRGSEDARDWMFKVQGYYPSFFAFWKRCKKEMALW